MLSTRLIRQFATTAALALALGVTLTLTLARPVAAQDDASDTQPLTATVVVQADEGAVVRPITFTAPISGLAALLATGLDVTVADSSFGQAVCAIEGVGCPAEDCFCNADEFWNYSYWNGDSWEGYPVGASASVITQTGSLEGWRWGVFEGTMAVSPQRVAAARWALDWLQAQQSASGGGYGGMAGTAETLLAIGANGLDAAQWRVVEAAPDLRTHARIQQTKFTRKDVASAGKVAVGIAATDACWTANAIHPSAYFSATIGAYSSDAGFNAWGILGTLALSETVPSSAVDVLRDGILPAGGWEWQAGFGADSNTTALAIQTLIAAGEPLTATEIVSGLAYLKQAQQTDGGFAYDLTGGNGSDANSTAYALQALAAAGEDPTSDRWKVEGKTAVDYLLSLQLDDGSFEWRAGTGSNLFATQQAIPALLGRVYPFAVKSAERCARK